MPVPPTFGPVIGGLLSFYINWQSIFWFLAIFSGVSFLVILTMLPETCRVVVGNGSIPSPTWNKSLVACVKTRKTDEMTNKQPQQILPPKRRTPSLFQSLRILGDKESGIVLIYSALFFAGYYMVITGFPSQLQQGYGYDSLQIGLCYIPAGLGSAAAAFAMGRSLDWNFKRWAKRLGIDVSSSRQQDLREFPIEAARLQAIFPIAFAAGASVIGFGWLLQRRSFIAAPLVFLFLSTFCISCTFQGLSTLVVDLNRDHPSSATAAMNLARCWLGAGASAFCVPLIKAVGIGWSCVLAAAVWALLSPIVLYVMKYGPGWREEKASKEQKQTVPTSSHA